ncbi:MAG TPA: prepilin-type N-terminal cleavage/methylation domain-containing protein [Rhodanobacteraceae bacterium]|nr:prepilin-type N-terminal cleavage/methylation domain-containing protein [Rhodanobacteraceae bacterium]
MNRVAIHRMRTTRAPSRQAGFSLIEMVAAFLVFAIGIGVLMQILATSMHNARSSSDYTMAALWAQSKLDVVGVGAPIEEGSSNGRFDDNYSWQLEVHMVDPTSVEPPPQVAAGNTIANDGPQQRMTTSAGNAGAIQVSPFDIYQLDLTVFWGGRFGASQKSAHFSTLRAMNPDPTTQMGTPGATGAGGQMGGAIKR